MFVRKSKQYVLNAAVGNHKVRENDEGQEGDSGSESKGDEGDPQEQKQEEEDTSKQVKKETKQDSEAKTLLKEVMQKKDQIRELEAKATESEKTLAKVLEKLQAFEEVEEQNSLRKLEEEKDFEGVKQRMVEKAQAQLEKAVQDAVTPLQEQISQLSTKDAERDALFVSLKEEAEFSKATDFLTAETVMTPRLARKAYADHFDLDENMNYVPYDKPKGSANRQMLVGADGEPMMTVDALKELIKSDPDSDSIIRSKIMSGSGSESQSGKVDERSKQPSVKGQGRILQGLNAKK